MEVSFLRQSGWVTPEMLDETVVIIGCGAVGSWIAMTAARMGFTKFLLFDADAVEAHNVSNQAYDVEHIGQDKATALSSVLTRFNPLVQVEARVEFFTAETELEDLSACIIATDTMSSRKAIGAAVEDNPFVSRCFEVRLGWDYGMVSVFDSNDESEYSNWFNTLGNDEDIEDGPCNLRMCVDLAMFSAISVVHQLCAMYVAEAQEVNWNYAPQTHIMFKEGGFPVTVPMMKDGSVYGEEPIDEPDEQIQF